MPGGRQAKELRLAIEVTQQHARLDASDLGDRIDVNALHP
jgi:hypothetical protein